MRYKVLAVFIILILFTTAGSANPKLASIRVTEVSPTSVHLVGRVNNFENVSEYGFAYSEFPLPPILDQRVVHKKIEGRPFVGTNFSIYLDELEQGKHYFFSTYYVVNGKYHYSDSYSYSTPRTARMSLETKTIEYTNDSIIVPLNIVRSREVTFGKISIKFDPEKINVHNYKFEGIPQGSYQRAHIIEYENYSVFEINFMLNENIELSKIRSHLELRLDRTINQSGFTTLEFADVSLYQKDGKPIDVDFENGTIHYQYKGSRENLYDKVFSDNDMTYRRSIEDLAESIKITHTSQIILSRWRMGIPNFGRDNSRIEINNHYYAKEYPQDKREILESFILSIPTLQRNDIAKEGVDLLYTNPQGLAIRFKAQELEEVANFTGNWEIVSSSISKARLRDLEKDHRNIISSYEVSSNATELAEIRFPVDPDISQKDLRVIAINDLGQEKMIIPYYIRRADGKLFACIEDNPNAIFILTTPEQKIVENILNESKYYFLDRVYDFESPSYLNENNHLMLPARILEEFYNLRLNWNANTGQLKISDGRDVIVTINSNIVVINSSAHYITNVAEFRNNRVFLPREIFEKIFDANISFNNVSKSITIRY